MEIKDTVDKESIDSITSRLENMLIPCDYILESKLGKGVFGEIYLGTLERDPSIVAALKKISKRSPKFDPQMVTREMNAGKLLKHHGIVEYQKYFETLSNIYLVFEYIDGEDLCNHITGRDFEPLPEEKAKKIISQIVPSLLYCHDQGIAHRDIKLDNILLTKDGKIKLIDFGLCTPKMNKTDCSNDYVGSPEYVAPEILRRKPYNPFIADIFSLGVVLYSLLVAEFPFTTKERWDKVAIGGHPAIRWGDKGDLKESLSKEAIDLIEKLLEVDPEKRITLEDVLNHKWFHTTNSSKKAKKISSIFKSCRSFDEKTVNHAIKLF